MSHETLSELTLFDCEPDAPEAPEARSIEDWCSAKLTAPHWFAAAKFHARWGQGRVLTESAYDAAVDAVQKIELR